MENDMASGPSSTSSDAGRQPVVPEQKASAGFGVTQSGKAEETGKKRLLPADWIANQASKVGPAPRPLHPNPNGSSGARVAHITPRPNLKPLRFNGALSYVSDARQSQSFEGMELLQQLLDAAEARDTTPSSSSSASALPSSSSSSSYPLCEGPLVLGFDMEWTTRFVAGQPPGKTAVLQLALGPAHKGGAVFVFHVLHLQPLPPLLVKILCDGRVKKVGVGIGNDVCKLAADFAADLHEKGSTGLKGFQEISELATAALGRPSTASSGPMRGGWAPKWSLADLVLRCLPGYVLHKPPHLRTGNWDKRPLHPDQLCYAATDAWASIRVYDSLMASLPSPPPLTDINYTHPRYAQPALPLPSSSSSSSSSSTTTPSPPSLDDSILTKLPPSKREAYLLWSQGLSLSQVAAQKGVKCGTVSSYVGEAIGLGAAYDATRLEKELEESMGEGQGAKLVDRATRAFEKLLASPGEGEEGGPRLGDMRREVAAIAASEEGEGQGGGYWELAVLYRHLVRRAQEGKEGEGKGK